MEGIKLSPDETNSTALPGFSEPGQIEQVEINLDLIHQSIGDRLFHDFADEEGGKQFLAKAMQNGIAMQELAMRPQFIHELYQYQREIFDDPKKFESFLRNSRERQKALQQGESALNERLSREPFATEEEVEAGIYKEFLEPQVRDAIFMMRRKGYGTFESGFDNLIEGTQYVGASKGTFESITFPPDRIDALRSKGVELSIIESEDRSSLLLLPNRDINLKEWKEIWDEVAAFLPDLGHPAVPGLNKSLIEKQNAMKAGEYVYLGGNVFYEKGNITIKE